MATTMIMTWMTAIFLCLFTPGHCIRITSCSSDPTTDIVKITSYSATPDPTKVPGDVVISISTDVTQPLGGDLQADVTLSRNVGGMWIDVPCFSTSKGQFGSCTYRDICHSIANPNGTCPKMLADNGIPCTCPIPSATYTIPQVTIPVDLKLFGFRAPGISGEYQASIRVTDVANMTEIACFDIEFQLTEPSSRNMFRNIGRFFYNLFG